MSATPSSCRILTIASSVQQARQLVESIITAQQTNDVLPTSQPTPIPWTISNKYYSALVHFFIIQTSEVTLHHSEEVLACLFIFDPTTEFKHDFILMANRLEDADFDVSIAVSTPAAISTEDHDALEEFFGNYGFEYVKGQITSNQYDLEGIPGINRVIDALSTIMWPSMVQKPGSRRAKSRSIVSVPGEDEEAEGLRALLSADKDTDASMGSTAFQRELAALEEWLQDDTWTGATASSAPSTGGFDDNFGDFVSAQSDLDLPSQAEINRVSRQVYDMGTVQAEDENDLGSFDLSRVLAELDAMKGEISTMANEDERRKAAARVALGLVYGLDEDG